MGHHRPRRINRLCATVGTLAVALTLVSCTGARDGESSAANNLSTSSSSSRVVTESTLPPSQNTDASAVVDASVATTVSPVPDVAMFVCTSSTWVQLFQWSQSADQIAGTVTVTLLDENPPDERLSSSTLTMSGAIAGSRLSMTISGRPQIFGTLDSSQLVLQVQQQDGRLAEIRCESTDPTGWNRAVAELQNYADQDNAWAGAASHQAQAESDLAAAQRRLAFDVQLLADSALSLDSNTALADQIGVMQQSLDEVAAALTKVESYTTCGYGEPTFDAENTRYQAENVESETTDLTTLIGDLSDASTGTNGIQGLIDAVNEDLATLQLFGADPEVSASAAIQAGKVAVADTAKAISWAEGKAKEIGAAAEKAASAAEGFASELCD